MTWVATAIIGSSLIGALGSNSAANTQASTANNATAALYRYTPHVFNGNYNFWKFFIIFELIYRWIISRYFLYIRNTEQNINIFLLSK